MSNEPIKPQDTPEEPKPADELAEEQLDDVNAGASDYLTPLPPNTSINFTPLPQQPTISPNIEVIKKAK